MRTMLNVLVVAAITLAAASCARSAGTTPTDRDATATLIVDNQSTLQATIYVHRGAERLRLGTAAALTETSFAIPQALIFGPTSLRFEASPLGSRQTPISEQIVVGPGEEIRLRIPSTVR